MITFKEFLAEAPKEKYDHHADTDENGDFKTDFKPRSYEAIYDDVKRIMSGFVIGRMRGDKADADFYSKETDEFHTDSFHDVTRKLEKGSELDSILDSAYEGIDEIKDRLSDRYGKIDGGSSLSALGGNKALQKKLAKRTGGNTLDMEVPANTVAFEKAMRQIPEFAEAERVVKWERAKHDHDYNQREKAKTKHHTSKGGLDVAVKQFDAAFDKAFSQRMLEKIRKGDHGYHFEDWGFSKENPPKNVADIFKTLKEKHGWKGVLEWVSNDVDDDENDNGLYYIGKSKKSLDYLVANSTKLAAYR